MKPRKFKLNELSVEYFYDYDTLFKTLLLQYKECYDEALKDVFLYKIDIYIKLKYWNYSVIYVPSSICKKEKRGFDHLKLIFERLGLKEVSGLSMKQEIVQESKNRKQREKMKDNYVYNGPHLDKVLIVDDVCTTGASLIGVYNAIKDKSKLIKALVLAKS